MHVPFCRDRCTYCAFATLADDPALHDSFVDGLLAEYARWGGSASWKTIYIGGGTPGLLAPALLEHLLSTLRAGEHAPPTELTLEVNPANVTPDRLAAWRDLGVNRLSVGVQTFNDTALRRLARRHDGADADHALETIASTWTASWTADLLVGWDGTTPELLERDLERLLRHEPPHVSIYGLELEPGTQLSNSHQNGIKSRISLDQLALHETLWTAHLEAAGLARYETSNFARPGHESHHNRAYWANSEYLGLGPGACSSIGQLRWANRRDTPRWLAAVKAGRSCRLSAELIRPLARLLETLAIGLRMSVGIERAELDRRFGPAWLDVLMAQADELTSVGLDLDEQHLRLIEPERSRLDGALKLLASDWPVDSRAPW